MESKRPVEVNSMDDELLEQGIDDFISYSTGSGAVED
jgi:hypothetical protein